MSGHRVCLSTVLHTPSQTLHTTGKSPYAKINEEFVSQELPHCVRCCCIDKFYCHIGEKKQLFNFFYFKLKFIKFLAKELKFNFWGHMQSYFLEIVRFVTISDWNVEKIFQVHVLYIY